MEFSPLPSFATAAEARSKRRVIVVTSSNYRCHLDQRGEVSLKRPLSPEAEGFPTKNQQKPEYIFPSSHTGEYLPAIIRGKPCSLCLPLKKALKCLIIDPRLGYKRGNFTYLSDIIDIF
ncbi:MAG: hypothetical protein HRU09_02740 [Oligoflexales bacterium]|nr:hypothetical protein [Oligoflexales bacterium]